jgi:hypothetical protein
VDHSDRQRQVERALAELAIPAGLAICSWAEADFPAIQRLSSAAGWPTPTARPEAALISWCNAWPALVAICGGEMDRFYEANGFRRFQGFRKSYR